MLITAGIRSRGASASWPLLVTQDELIASKDETISKLVKEQSAKDEASKVEIESLIKKNEEMRELLASINKQISSNVKVESAKMQEPKDQPESCQLQRHQDAGLLLWTRGGARGEMRDSGDAQGRRNVPRPAEGAPPGRPGSVC